MNKIVAGFAMIMVMLGSASCKLGRKAMRKNVTVDSSVIARDSSAILRDTAAITRTDSTQPAGNTLSEEKKALISNLLPLFQKRIQFNTFSGKAKMHYVGKDQDQEFVASIRIQKDNVIWVTITATFLNVQVARAMITPDSIKLINYLEREVILMRTSEASRLLPVNVDFSTLQNLLIGNTLSADGTPVDATDFGGTLSLVVDNAEYTQQLAYNKPDSTMRSSQAKAKQANGPSILIQYGNYKLNNNQQFPESRAINIVNGADQHYLDMNFSEAIFDQPVEFPFSIPSKYTVKQ